MKFKISFLTILLLNVFITRASDFGNFTPYAKITAIDKELSQAKSVEQIKAVALKMYAIICKHLNDTCPPPSKSDYEGILADIGTGAKAPANEIEYYEYNYEKRLLEMACVNIKVDNEETVKKKLQLFWNKYKKKFTCDSLSFSLSNGNILKFALAQNKPGIIETFVSYGLDINFIDPADGLNLLDWIDAEIEQMKKRSNRGASIKVYEDYKAGVIGLGGKSNKK